MTNDFIYSLMNTRNDEKCCPSTQPLPLLYGPACLKQPSNANHKRKSKKNSTLNLPMHKAPLTDVH